MILTLFVPEVILGLAAANLYAAMVNTPIAQRKAIEDGVPWTLSHTFFSNIGGISIRFPEEAGPPLSEDRSVPPAAAANNQKPARSASVARNRLWGINYRDPEYGPGVDLKLRHSWKWNRILGRAKKLNRYGEVDWRPHEHHRQCVSRLLTKWSALDRSERDFLDVVRFEGNVWVLDTKQLMIARDRGIIGSLPDLTEEQIADKDKGDFLVRLLAVVQVGWLFVQLIARKKYGYPCTTLEVTTAAFAVLALITYSLQWSKPKDVGTPHYIKADRVASVEDIEVILEAEPDVIYKHTGLCNISNASLPRPIEEERSSGFKSEFTSMVGIFILTNVVASAIFGAIHLTAWNFAFPTQNESTFWKASSVLTIAGPLWFYISEPLWRPEFTRWIEPYIEWPNSRFAAILYFCVRLLHYVISPVVFLAFFIGRLYIIGETFRGVFSLRPEDFQSTWAANLPHVG
ncbi:hypothetical protein V492_02376 [Pseudogymnoascus sp. VKM F-4246]|nr:hypothetical protein V492_02376 [Pseudogymnoascus sp. VKM F-4246]